MNNIFDLSGKGFDQCTSCQACYAVCKQKALTIKLDKQGFYRPEINEEDCVGCGLCKKVCYRFERNMTASSDNMGVWACKCNDKSILEKVSSGGISYLLCNIAVANGYKVLGIAYNYKSNIAEARITDNDIEQFVGSKYIQAYTADVYYELVNRNYGNKYLIFGLPCQIYAIDKIAKIKGFRDRIMLVDLFCHGCPSMLLWQKTIADLKSRCNVDNFDKIEFRSKKNKWHEFCIYCEKSGTKYLTQNEYYPFYELFFSDEILNDACKDCILRGSFDYCDIRIGDFWGSDYDTDGEGVSVVVAASEMGRKWIKKLPEETFVKEHMLQDATVYQSFGTVYHVNPRIRDNLLNSLAGEEGIDSTVKLYLEMLPTKSKAIRSIKRIVVAMPHGIKSRLRKYVHKKKHI